MTIIKLKRDMAGIEARVGRLERTVRQLRGDRPVSPPASEEPLDQEQLLAWMRAEGLIRAPTDEERRLGAEWDALPEKEKQAVLWELDHLPPGPMVSEIVIENRR